MNWKINLLCVFAWLCINDFHHPQRFTVRVITEVRNLEHFNAGTLCLILSTNWLQLPGNHHIHSYNDTEIYINVRKLNVYINVRNWQYVLKILICSVSSSKNTGSIPNAASNGLSMGFMPTSLKWWASKCWMKAVKYTELQPRREGAVMQWVKYSGLVIN